MKAFTFLGKGPLYKSTYVFDGKECETQFFAEAIVEFFSPESLYFFATESAANAPVSDDNKCERLKFLTELLNEKTKIVHIPIEEGADEEELWKIFDTVVGEIKDNDEVLFDITHGFRSLPFLTFLALAYVRNVRSGVEIERVIYGAFDAVDRDNPRKPVFDLTPFVSLLDWLGAVTMFQRTGDSRPIASLNDDSDIGKALTSLSKALLTNRTLEAQEAAYDFNRKFSGSEFAASSEQPFQMLIDQLKQSYQQMAVHEPRSNPKGSLKAQYEQIKWYMKNQHYLQAITLMREWLISFECFSYLDHWLERDTRAGAEDDLNQHHDEIDKKVIDLWERCRIRGDLAHCGMRLRVDSSTQAIEAIEELFNKFQKYYRTIDWKKVGIF